MNIPGLDAPSWSRTGGVDETQEAEEEEAAARQWKKDQQTGSQKVQFTPASGVSASAVPLSCDLLVVGCGMMAASFLAAVTSDAKVEEVGRFTVPPAAAAAASSSSGAPASAASAASNGVMILARSAAAPNTLFVMNYLRVTAPQYFALTEALFSQVKAKEVLLFDTLPEGAFISTDRPLPCPPLLRRLQSSSCRPEAASTVRELEPPNVVFGYSASVLTQCEVSHLPAQLFVSVESRHYMVECYAAYEQAWASLASWPAAAAFVNATQSFVGANDSVKTKVYKSAIAAMKATYGYTAGADSSMRETAAQVQRDHRDAMYM